MLALKQLVCMAFCLTGVYGWQSCWLQSCDIIKSLEVSSTTIMTQQEELNNRMNYGLNVSVRNAFSAAEMNMTTMVVDNIASSESNVLDAIKNSKGELLASVAITTGKISNTIAAINAATANQVNTSEGNIVSALKSELGTSEGNVITTVLAELDVTQKTLNARMDEIVAALSARPTPFSPGFNVDAFVTGRYKLMKMVRTLTKFNFTTL